MAAAAANTPAPVIIKKIKKGGGHGHHGGAWKVAYADFVTAMMAFFLLMWLINTTSMDQKRGIAEFFAPAAVSSSASGSGGLLAGTALAQEGVQNGLGAPVLPKVQGIAQVAQTVDAQTPEGGIQPTDDALAKARALREDTEFDRAEMSIRQAIQDMPDLAELSKQVIMEKTPEGLRIQLIDQDGRSMFEPGAAEPNRAARKLLEAVAQVVADLPNRVSIAGHTDDGPAPRPGYTNWELSSDRANAARRILTAAHLPKDRIAVVAGKADAEPLFPDDPTLPGNRRISITLLRESPVLPPGHDLAE